jgi:hypothetical protein
MTEAEWLAATNAKPMLEFIGSRASERKLRLFGVVCCRLIGAELTDERSRTAVEVAEQLADGNCSEHDRHSSREAANEAMFDLVMQQDFEQAALAQKARFCLENTESLTRIYTPPGSRDALRDIFGNPFRPVTLDPAWITSTVVALARGIYDERAFDRMPILADALQDAGCDNAEVLNHCLDQEQRHFRGCWLVDLLLGKT